MINIMHDMEELAELIQALSKYIRYGDKESRNNIIEEILDVEIAIKDIKKTFHITELEILEYKKEVNKYGSSK